MPSTSQRLDRVDATLDRFAEETTRFEVAIGAAITAQRERSAENARMIAEVAELIRENARKLEELRREFPA